MSSENKIAEVAMRPDGGRGAHFGKERFNHGTLGSPQQGTRHWKQCHIDLIPFSSVIKALMGQLKTMFEDSFGGLLD